MSYNGKIATKNYTQIFRDCVKMKGGNYLSIIDKISKRKVSTTAPQTKASNPFDTICSYYPSMVSQPELYRNLREAVPIIDTAIYKLVRLTGGFCVETKTVATKKSLKAL